jgi:anti-sigma regulatory factor (Ser/Thr protein kinase)
MSTPLAPGTGQAAARPFSVPLPARIHSPAARPARAVPPPPADGQATPGRRGHPGSYARVDLGPDPAAAAQARRVTRHTLARWDMHHLIDDAEAIASELAANAINAATRPHETLPAIIFAIHYRPPELIIIIWDNGPGRPQHDPIGPEAETGRGLTIIDNLCDSNWGWWPTPRSGGKVVWAALPAPAEPNPPDRAC